MRYTVYVDDNSRYMDEGGRHRLGDFATAEEALAASRRIVDDFLQQALRPGMTARELFSGYTSFGEDPHIASDDPSCTFSAWDYARRRCVELTGTPLEEAGAPPSPGYKSIRAAIDVAAPGYEVQITVNGALIPFAGGKAFSDGLFGAPKGAGPLHPAVLLAGENQVGLSYRRTGDLDATLGMTVRGPSGNPLLEFGPVSGESGRFSGTFRLPDS